LEHFCAENECVCDNGTSTSGTSCPYDGEEDCVLCDAGFELNGNTCDMITTVAVTTTLFPTTTLSELAQKCEAVVSDVAFVLDGSTSVSVENFQNAVNFMKSIVDPLSVSPDGTQIGLAQYATFSRVEFPFQSDKDATYAALDGISQIFGGTFTGKAITATTNDLFATYGRPGANPVIVLITDGRSFDGLVTPANNFKATGGELFVIGVGDADLNQLNQMASEDPENPGEKFVWFNDWEALSTINIEISEKICALASP
jgi:uncharacterized protein YegL